MTILRTIASFLGSVSPAHIRFVTMVSGAQLIGVDQLGNRYYSARPRKGYKRDRRWVIYSGAVEASMIPPEWHGWMHHQTDTVPADGQASFRRTWQKPHAPNLTGTDQAYRPEGHLLKSGQRAASDSDYQAWTPNDE